MTEANSQVPSETSLRLVDRLVLGAVIVLCVAFSLVFTNAGSLIYWFVLEPAIPHPDRSSAVEARIRDEFQGQDIHVAARQVDDVNRSYVYFMDAAFPIVERGYRVTYEFEGLDVVVHVVTTGVGDMQRRAYYIGGLPSHAGLSATDYVRVLATARKSGGFRDVEGLVPVARSSPDARVVAAGREYPAEDCYGAERLGSSGDGSHWMAPHDSPVVFIDRSTGSVRTLGRYQDVVVPKLP